jgi:hypothetical protein
MPFNRTITEDDLDAASAQFVRQLRDQTTECDDEFESEFDEGTLGSRILTTFTG